MSKNGFIDNGAVQKLPCSVQDYVFSDLDESQAFKCFAGLNEEFSKVWFFYPSIADNEKRDIKIRYLQLRRKFMERWHFRKIQLVSSWRVRQTGSRR